MSIARKTAFSLLTVTGMALGLLLSACDRADQPASLTTNPNPDPSAVRAATPYEKDVAALKLKETDPDRILSGIDALRARYAVLSASGALPAALGDAPIPGPGSLGLEKASATLKNYVPRTQNVGVIITPEAWITIKPGLTVEAWTTRSAGNQAADPVMVGYYRTSGDANSTAYKLNFIGFSDDYSGLDPHITWTNNTGVAQVIGFTAFAYNSAETGDVVLNYRAVGYATKILSTPMQATRIPYAQPSTGNCTGPSLTKIYQQRISSQSGENVLLAYNGTTGRGGYIYASTTMLTLDDVLPNSTNSFLIGYREFDPSNLYEPALYKGSQFDLYSCTP
jgi:hypothetical protein